MVLTLFLQCFNGTSSFFLLAGEEDGNREAGESEMDGQGEKTRHTAVGADEWDGPSKKNLHITFIDSILVPSGKVTLTKMECMLQSLR